MDPTANADANPPQNRVGEREANDKDIVSKRRELARLIGRLLAHRWLEQQRIRNKSQSAKRTADKKTTPSA